MASEQQVSNITYRSLRQNIVIVKPDVFLFNGTIRGNILYGKLDATEDEIILAAKRANIHDYVMTLVNKYEPKSAKEASNCRAVRSREFPLSVFF